MPVSEHHFLIGLTELLIGKGQYRSGIVKAHGHKRQIFEDGLAAHHEQRRRYAFPGYISHGYGQMAVIQHIEVIEIAADLFGGVHAGKEVKVRALKIEIMGQYTLLDIGGDIQFGFNALVFGGGFRKIGHFVGNGRQFLIVGGA